MTQKGNCMPVIMIMNEYFIGGCFCGKSDGNINAYMSYYFDFY